MRHRRLVTLCALALLLLTSLPDLRAAGEPAEGPLHEIIVLLDAAADSPVPEALVDGIRRRSGVASAFLAGNPVNARPALSRRATGDTLKKLRARPDSPRARLERYVVLSYPPGTDLAVVMEALRKNPHVLHVERNGFFELSVVPNDPLVPEQWSLPMLDLFNGWDRAKGHAYVGLIDVGLQVNHPDLAAFPVHEERTIIGDNGVPKTICGYQDGPYLGGNFRPHLSRDEGEGDCNVDERDPLKENNHYGHGTHVAGIVAATTDNGQGIAGTCWNCSLMIAKANQESILTFDKGAAALTFLVEHGAQIASMSWGGLGNLSCGASSQLAMLCQALALAEAQDLVLTASAGNDKMDIRFPASDSRVMSIGGLEADGSFWDEANNGGCPLTGSTECGSNYTLTAGSAQQDLVAPARQVLSTMYEGFEWNPVLGCGDSTHPASGYGLCTGTSMSSPYVAGITGVVRSINPLLTKAQVRDALIKNASLGSLSQPDARLGFGVPDAAASADAVLGKAAGRVLPNRLTPLFRLYSFDAAAHLSTTVPQMAAAALLYDEVSFSTFAVLPVISPPTPDYFRFPGAPCQIAPCDYEPRASVYLLTTDKAPFPGAPPLVPLYRMSFDEPWNGNLANRSFFYTTEKDGVERGKALGYELDGIEGYMFGRCTPEPACIPKGAVRLFRLYNFQRDDYALFPESEEAAYRSAEYVSQPGMNDVIGYAYPNQDTDLDDVIDGFERLAGTNPLVADSDCDGLSDGEELLVYDSDGYGDPLAGSCTALNVHIADTFTGAGALNGRPAEVGGVSWTARPAAVVTGGRVIDGVALGGVPFDPSTLRSETTVAVSADVNPALSNWVGVGFASQATTPYWSAGQLWVLLRPEGTYTVNANGTSLSLGSGTIPGTPTNGYHGVEIRYHKLTNAATVLINGVTVVAAQALGFTPNIQYAGFQMHSAAENGAGIDNFQVKTVAPMVDVLIADSFTGSGALSGRQTESGGVTWSARQGAVIVGGRVTDSAAIGAVPFAPSTLGGNPTVAVAADVDPAGTEWVGVGFASQATTAYWSSGQIWVLLRPVGGYSAFANGTAGLLATGTIPGTPTGGVHRVEIRYHTSSNAATILLNGITVVASQPLTFTPNIQVAGFHMYRAAEGGSKIDNFQVLSTAAP